MLYPESPDEVGVTDEVKGERLSSAGSLVAVGCHLTPGLVQSSRFGAGGQVLYCTLKPLYVYALSQVISIYRFW